MSGFGSSILIEAAPPRVPACLIRNAGWLYSGFVAATSRTADADSSAPSFDVIEIVAIVFLRQVGVFAPPGAPVIDVARIPVSGTSECNPPGPPGTRGGTVCGLGIGVPRRYRPPRIGGPAAAAGAAEVSRDPTG